MNFSPKAESFMLTPDYSGHRIMKVQLYNDEKRLSTAQSLISGIFVNGCIYRGIAQTTRYSFRLCYVRHYVFRLYFIPAIDELSPDQVNGIWSTEMHLLTSFLDKLGATIALVLMFFAGLSAYADSAFPDSELSEDYEAQSSPLNCEHDDQTVEDRVEYDDKQKQIKEGQQPG
ncbi:hypothetical protein [Endozoicomonas sp. SCSIO W0465]|uniref:hypothetical protein n=1 Tax=Endozoicomonas sp. SCSIO W0465 TaxID=2918516 RepID=UPI002074D47C|nr:hypothetical protein [Endozoicomonas sp. SCSIO W0465]USE35673.1 hypothetical protein MJO57_26985 [Endozoicomonas sp. SCSIO W0465]